MGTPDHNGVLFFYGGIMESTFIIGGLSIVLCIVMFYLGWVLSTKLGQGKVANAERLAEKLYLKLKKKLNHSKNKK